MPSATTPSKKGQLCYGRPKVRWGHSSDFHSPCHLMSAGPTGAQVSWGEQGATQGPTGAGAVWPRALGVRTSVHNPAARAPLATKTSLPLGAGGVLFHTHLYPVTPQANRGHQPTSPSLLHLWSQRGELGAAGEMTRVGGPARTNASASAKQPSPPKGPWRAGLEARTTRLLGRLRRAAGSGRGPSS